MYKIAIIIPYYGTMPNYFMFWLKSVENNPTIQFFIISDSINNVQLPVNVKIINWKFSELKKNIQNMFDFKITLEVPYKLVEYKPLYGVILKDHLREYDFWGCCDMDLIFGNIREFIKDNILDENDLILSHGHFMLYRNIEEMNKLYLKPNINGEFIYKKAFTTNLILHFDEWGGISKIAADYGIKMYDHIIFADIRYQFYDFRLAQQKKWDKKKRVFVWKDKEIYALVNDNQKLKKEYYMYIHLQKRPMKIEHVNAGEQMLIIPNQFIPYRELNAREINSLGRRKIIYGIYIKYRIKNLYFKIRNGGIQYKLWNMIKPKKV